MKSMLVLEETLRNWFIRDCRQRTFRKATARAYTAFVQKYPQWEERLFDEHFLTHRAAVVLGRYLEGHAPDPTALAQAWAEQWGWKVEARARFVSYSTPVAADFLYLLETELRNLWFASHAGTPLVTAGLKNG